MIECVGVDCSVREGSTSVMDEGDRRGGPCAHGPARALTSLSCAAEHERRRASLVNSSCTLVTNEYRFQGGGVARQFTRPADSASQGAPPNWWWPRAKSAPGEGRRVTWPIPGPGGRVNNYFGSYLGLFRGRGRDYETKLRLKLNCFFGRSFNC